MKIKSVWFCFYSENYFKCTQELGLRDSFAVTALSETIVVVHYIPLKLTLHD